MQVHLVDGTYELFRSFYGAPAAQVGDREVGAARGLLRSLAAWLKAGEVTHVGVAFDHVIESFRNQLFAGYKTGDGIEPTLWAQFPLAERVAAALGCAVWPMIEFEADDALEPTGAGPSPGGGAAAGSGAAGGDLAADVAGARGLGTATRDDEVPADRRAPRTDDAAPDPYFAPKAPLQAPPVRLTVGTISTRGPIASAAT